MTRVLVTGASGFLASHIVLQLLERGEFMVRGTVRSLKNDKKVAPLRNLRPENGKYELELVEADLTNKESWTEAVRDCTFVIHVASPFPADHPRDEMEVIRPAVEGTKNVLEACAKTKGGVKRVVLTSSTAAICGGRYDEDIVFSEKEWASEEASSPYGKSKLQAEKTAWELVENLPDDEKFELCTINPGFILGPILQGTSCTSMELHRRFLQREVPMVPNLCYPACDVRDVAGAHITAMTSPTAPGNRFMTVTDSLWIPEMAKILDEEFRPLGYNVPTRVAPNFVLRILGLFSDSVRMILPSLGCAQKFDNSKVKHNLQYKATELRTSIIDMAYSMIDGGFINKTLQYQEKKAH